MSSLPIRLFIAWLLSVAGASAQTAPARPAPPPVDAMAMPGRAGWTIDATNGCWLWNPSPHPGETVAWSGICPLGPAQGAGSAAWRYFDNDRPLVAWEHGVMRDGRLDGQGVVLWSNGDRHEGEWLAGQRHGRGTTFETDGTRHDGEWRLGAAHGPGTLTRPNGDTYHGDFRAGRAEGQGVLMTREGAFQGLWRDGCLRRGDGVAAGVGRPGVDCPP